MRPHRVVVNPPTIDQDLGFTQRVEDLAVEQLVSEFAVEALDVPVLPWTPGLDVQRGHAHFAQPVPHHIGGELRSIIRANIFRYAPRGHQPGQSLKHIIAAEIPRHINRKTLPRVLIDHREHPKAPTVMCPGMDKVVTPDMVLVLGSQPDARSTTEHQSTSFTLLFRHLDPFLLPDSLDPFVIDAPAFKPEHRGDPAVAVSAVHARELDDPLC